VAGEHTRRACAGRRRVRRKNRQGGISTLHPVRPGQRSTRGASNRTRGGCAPQLCPTLLAESGRGRPHSMTLRVRLRTGFIRPLWDGAWPLALSITADPRIAHGQRRRHAIARTCPQRVVNAMNRPLPDAHQLRRPHWNWGAYAPRVCWRTPHPPKNRQGGHFYASPCSPRPAFDARRVEPHPDGGAPLLCPTLLAESGRRLPHSKTLRVCPCARFMRQLLDCACPLALSTNKNSLVQDKVSAPPASDDALTRQSGSPAPSGATSL